MLCIQEGRQFKENCLKKSMYPLLPYQSFDLFFIISSYLILVLRSNFVIMLSDCYNLKIHNIKRANPKY